ncbi:MAG: hypothetical protein PF569_10000 [Candidatus Woesearchaeota archaeon]|jgi:hypothetical protein|nr:hypothetical protein [Candidatus Woesearchaeota archaeon]
MSTKEKKVLYAISMRHDDSRVLGVRDKTNYLKMVSGGDGNIGLDCPIEYDGVSRCDIGTAKEILLDVAERNKSIIDNSNGLAKVEPLIIRRNLRMLELALNKGELSFGVKYDQLLNEQTYGLSEFFVYRVGRDQLWGLKVSPEPVSASLVRRMLNEYDVNTHSLVRVPEDCDEASRLVRHNGPVFLTYSKSLHKIQD